MAIGRVPGAALLSDLDRQGLDLQFTTNSQTLVYLDFANFRLGVNTLAPTQALDVTGSIIINNGGLLVSANNVSNIGNTNNWFNTAYIRNLQATTLTGTIATANQPNISNVGSLGNLTVLGNITAGNVQVSSSLRANTVNANVITATILNGTIATANQPNIANLSNITVTNVTVNNNVVVTGYTISGTVQASAVYDSNNRVLTDNTIFVMSGDATSTGNISNIQVTLANTGVIPGIYGSADDEYADRIPKITVDSKGRITNIANVTLTQVGNVTFANTTISTTSNLTLAPASKNINANTSIISNVANPVNEQDAATKNYVNSVVNSTANIIYAGDSSVKLTDTGSGKLEIIIDGNLIANATTATTTIYNTVNIGNLSLNGQTITSTGDLLLTATGAGIVQIVGSDAIGLPAGGIGDRPAVPMVGYTRFNTDTNLIETWDGDSWNSPTAQTITSELITPDGVSNTFTLTSNVNSAFGVLVSINGTLQQPITAYDVIGNQIAFNEIPQVSDIIEVRTIASGIAISALQYGNTEVHLTSNKIEVTGNVMPAANATYSIGTEQYQWKEVWGTVQTPAQPNITQVGQLTDLSVAGNVTVSSNVKFTGWHIYESNNTLYFAFNNAVKMSLTSSGNLTVSGTITP